MARSPSLPMCLVVLPLLLGTACSDPPPRPDDAAAPPEAASSGEADAGRPVVRFAGRTLTEADVIAAMRQLPAPSRAYLKDPARRRDFVDDLVLNELLYDEGQRLGYDDDPEVERQVLALRKRLVVQRLMRDYRKRPEVTDDEARAYYDEHRALYSGMRVRASHILLKDRETAEEVRAELLEHPDRFAALARERSTDQMSAKRGGDLGRFGPGRMVGEVEQVAFTLAEGGISEVVESRYGFHVIMVTERSEGRQRSFEEVAPQVRSKLAAERLQRDVEAQLATLREAANVRVDDAVVGEIEVPEVEAGGTSGFHAH